MYHTWDATRRVGTPQTTVSHHSCNMPLMKDPSKVLGAGISWIDDSRDVLKFHFSTRDPFLDGIVLDIIYENKTVIDVKLYL